jgi:hypothetical protein
MRLDENGGSCPATLGEYRDFCVVLFGKESEPVKFLEKEISESANGADEPVLAADSQMRYLLFSMATGV